MLRMQMDVITVFAVMKLHLPSLLRNAILMAMFSASVNATELSADCTISLYGYVDSANESGTSACVGYSGEYIGLGDSPTYSLTFRPEYWLYDSETNERVWSSLAFLLEGTDLTIQNLKSVTFRDHWLREFNPTPQDEHALSRVFGGGAISGHYGAGVIIKDNGQVVFENNIRVGIIKK